MVGGHCKCLRAMAELKKPNSLSLWGATVRPCLRAPLACSHTLLDPAYCILNTWNYSWSLMGVLEKLVNCILEVHEGILYKTPQETACWLVIVIYRSHTGHILRLWFRDWAKVCWNGSSIASLRKSWRRHHNNSNQMKNDWIYSMFENKIFNIVKLI